jgi:hypothetical protein
MSAATMIPDTELVTEVVRFLRLGAARADLAGPYDDFLDLVDRHDEQIVRLLATGAGMPYPLPETEYLPAELNEDGLEKWLVMRWAHERGYSFVGPFPSADAAGRWATRVDEEVDPDPCWQVVRLDPTQPLPVRQPELVVDQGTEAEIADWLDHVSDYVPPTGRRCFVLMTTSEPVHLVGPFQNQRSGAIWGAVQERCGGDDGWQGVWIADADCLPVLQSPEEWLAATG